MVHICNSLYWKYCGGNNHCYHFLNKKLFIYQRISWNFVSVVIFLFYTYGFFFSNAIIDVKFCFSSSVWNLIMKRILKNIFSLFIEAWILMKSSELLWLSVIQMFIYIYICNNNCIIQILLFIIEWFDCRNIFVTWYINY